MSERVIRFDGLLRANGWMMPAFVKVDYDGLILNISQEQSVKPVESVSGLALPGFFNAHSHAFQYAMAGVAENHPAARKAADFWSWRKVMYDLASKVEPEDLEAIASFLYREMVRVGYIHVVEFHYLHHARGGHPYIDRAEMGHRLIRAAKKVGIGITLIPIFYQKGGFGVELESWQLRFQTETTEKYLDLIESTREACRQYGKARLGIGVHSLRAAEPESIMKLLNDREKTLPFHIHAAEQLREVEESKTHLGARPVQWLIEHADLNDNFCIVHATHTEEIEIEQLAKSTAKVVLCPTTEGNLGDGLFRFPEYIHWGGKWCVGTDSHISLSFLDEIRLLDYGQRNRTHHREIFRSEESADSGQNALVSAISAGRIASGFPEGNFLEPGLPLDCLVIDNHHPLIGATSAANLAATIVYTSDPSMYFGTMIGGQWVILRGSHAMDRPINSAFVKTLNRLGIR